MEKFPKTEVGNNQNVIKNKIINEKLSTLNKLTPVEYRNQLVA